MKKANNNKSNQVPNITKEMSFCIANGVKVYPIQKLNKWYIQSDTNGKIKTFDKEVPKNDICLSVAKTYIYYYEKLKEIENGINKVNNNK